MGRRLIFGNIIDQMVYCHNPVTMFLQLFAYETAMNKTVVLYLPQPETHYSTLERKTPMPSAGKAIFPNKKYTSRIIKAGALLADTKTLFIYWDETRSIAENLSRIRQENIFGKASRSRVEDILTIFHQRYLVSEDVIRSLSILVRQGFPDEALERILYFFAVQSDMLLHDIVTDVLLPLRTQGKIDINSASISSVLTKWLSEGRMAAKWSDETIERVTQGLLATLRDFGILQGATKKRLVSIYLPIEAFAYITFYMRQRQPSGERLLNDPEWQLFFLSTNMVEHCFMEAHQLHLLEYQAAGSIIRITFPATTLEEYAYALAQRAH